MSLCHHRCKRISPRFNPPGETNATTTLPTKSAQPKVRSPRTKEAGAMRVCPECKHLATDNPHVCPSTDYIFERDQLLAAALLAEQSFSLDELEAAAAKRLMKQRRQA